MKILLSADFHGDFTRLFQLASNMTRNKTNQNSSKNFLRSNSLQFFKEELYYIKSSYVIHRVLTDADAQESLVSI